MGQMVIISALSVLDPTGATTGLLPPQLAAALETTGCSVTMFVRMNPRSLLLSESRRCTVQGRQENRLRAFSFSLGW